MNFWKIQVLCSLLLCGASSYNQTATKLHYVPLQIRQWYSSLASSKTAKLLGLLFIEALWIRGWIALDLSGRVKHLNVRLKRAIEEHNTILSPEATGTHSPYQLYQARLKLLNAINEDLARIQSMRKWFHFGYITDIEQSYQTLKATIIKTLPVSYQLN